MSKKDYEIGYGKPPKEARFKPGKSGNPKGRPKGTKSLATALNIELQETLTVLENGKRTEVTKMVAMAKRLVQKGLEGDIRAFREIFNFLKVQGLLAEPLPIIQPYIPTRAEMAKMHPEVKLD